MKTCPAGFSRSCTICLSLLGVASSSTPSSLPSNRGRGFLLKPSLLQAGSSCPHCSLPQSLRLQPRWCPDVPSTHRLDGLHNRCIFSQLGGWSPRSRSVPFPGPGSLHGLWTMPSHHVLTCPGESRHSGVSSLRAPTRSPGPHPMILSNPDHLPKALPPNTITLGVRASTWIFGRDTDIASLHRGFQAFPLPGPFPWRQG